MPSRQQFSSNEEYNKWFSEYREKNRKKIRRYNKKYNKVWRKKYGYHNEENSKKRYPEKQYARRMVRTAILYGKLKKLSCEECGNKKSQAHHEDYSKPLEVIWLCSIHHTERHKKLST